MRKNDKEMKKFLYVDLPDREINILKPSNINIFTNELCIPNGLGISFL